jgi:hypothetical protein
MACNGSGGEIFWVREVKLGFDVIWDSLVGMDGFGKEDWGVIFLGSS